MWDNLTSIAFNCRTNLVAQRLLNNDEDQDTYQLNRI